MPKRVQRRRAADVPGIPAGAIYVGRPTKWGNPFQISSNRPTLFVHDGRTVYWDTPREDDADELARGHAVSMYRSLLESGDVQGLAPLLSMHQLPTEILHQRARILGDIRTLTGRDLCCWCPLDSPCHADVLLELANA